MTDLELEAEEFADGEGPSIDPTSNLAEQLTTAAALVAGIDGDEPVDPQALKDDAARLARLVLELSEWLAGGGDLPNQWLSGGAFDEAEEFAEGEATIAEGSASPFDL